MADSPTASTDLEGLAVRDTNGNGFFDEADESYHEFYVWRDLDQNGLSEAGELFSLASLNITSISLDSTPTLLDNSPIAGITQLNTSYYTRSDGTTSSIADVRLTFVEIEETSAIRAFPIEGDASANTILGTLAADNMSGFEGNDILFGGQGGRPSCVRRR